MSIRFTQYMRPNGRKVEAEIERGLRTELAAARFISAGGKFEAEVLSTNEISLTAAFKVDDEMQDIAIQVLKTREAVPAGVDRLVKDAIKWYEAYKDQKDLSGRPKDSS